MNKKILGIILVVAVVAVVGVVYLVGQGGSKNGAGEIESGNLPGEGEKTSQEVGDSYNSAEEIAVPAGLPRELKSLLSEACGDVKLTTLTYNLAGMNTDLMVYTWKNKPTEEKLMSLFKENGYEVEALVVGIFTAVKDQSFLTVDWNSADREDEREIVVSSAHE